MALGVWRCIHFVVRVPSRVALLLSVVVFVFPPPLSPGLLSEIRGPHVHSLESVPDLPCIASFFASFSGRRVGKGLGTKRARRRPEGSQRVHERRGVRRNERVQNRRRRGRAGGARGGGGGDGCSGRDRSSGEKRRRG